MNKLSIYEDDVFLTMYAKMILRKIKNYCCFNYFANDYKKLFTVVTNYLINVKGEEDTVLIYVIFLKIKEILNKRRGKWTF